MWFKLITLWKGSTVASAAPDTRSPARMSTEWTSSLCPLNLRSPKYEKMDKQSKNICSQPWNNGWGWDLPDGELEDSFVLNDQPRAVLLEKQGVSPFPRTLGWGTVMSVFYWNIKKQDSKDPGLGTSMSSFRKKYLPALCWLVWHLPLWDIW